MQGTLLDICLVDGGGGGAGLDFNKCFELPIVTTVIPDPFLGNPSSKNIYLLCTCILKHI